MSGALPDRMLAKALHLPAAQVQPAQNKVLFLMDQDAATLLSSKGAEVRQ